MKKNKKVTKATESNRNGRITRSVKEKGGIGPWDWVSLGVALTALTVTSVWSFVLTARSVNANVTVQAMLVGAGVILSYFCINSILKVIKK